MNADNRTIAVAEDLHRAKECLEEARMLQGRSRVTAPSSPKSASTS